MWSNRLNQTELNKMQNKSWKQMISITKAILYIEFIQILRTYSFYSIKFTFYDQYEVFSSLHSSWFYKRKCSNDTWSKEGSVRLSSKYGLHTDAMEDTKGSWNSGQGASSVLVQSRRISVDYIFSCFNFVHNMADYLHVLPLLLTFVPLYFSFLSHYI